MNLAYCVLVHRFVVSRSPNIPDLPLSMWSLPSWTQAVLISATFANALPWAPWHPPGGPYGGSAPAAKAVYVMTNDVTANAIVAMSVGPDGKLSGGSITPTGGKGSNLVHADGTIAFPDSLSGQDSVVSAGNVRLC